MADVSGGFWHGRTGQPPGAAFFQEEWRGGPPQSHLDFFPNNAHFIHKIKTQAYNLHVFVFSELCEMANKNR